MEDVGGGRSNEWEIKGLDWDRDTLGSLLEESDGRAEVALIWFLGNHALALGRGDHVDGSLRAETVEVDI